MKKSYTLFLMLTLIFSIMTACSFSEKIKISHDLGIDISLGTISDKDDNYGGFPADGHIFMKITFTEDIDKLENEIKNNDLWKDMPLSENLSTLVYGFESDSEPISSSITDKDGNALFPKIENGYYFFENTDDEYENISDDSQVLTNYMFDYIFAIYDKDTKTLYYVENEV